MNNSQVCAVTAGQLLVEKLNHTRDCRVSRIEEQKSTSDFHVYDMTDSHGTLLLHESTKSSPQRETPTYDNQQRKSQKRDAKHNPLVRWAAALADGKTVGR